MSGQLDPLFLVRMNAAMNDPNSPLFQNDLFLGAGIFSFRCNPVTGTCRNQPLGTPQTDSGTPGAHPTPPGPQVTPEGGECPINLRVSQQPPTISAQKIAPAYPIVVGQDPAKRGVDVSASIQVHPVIVKYDVPKYEHECQYVGGDVTDSACQNQPGLQEQENLRRLRDQNADLSRPDRLRHDRGQSRAGVDPLDHDRPRREVSGRARVSAALVAVAGPRAVAGRAVGRSGESVGALRRTAAGRSGLVHRADSGHDDGHTLHRAEALLVQRAALRRALLESTIIK